MKKLVLGLVALTAIASGALAQPIVNIPDAAFKTYLVTNTAINTNMDSEIQTTEAHAFTGYINCPGLGITDLTGIEAFDAVESLNCSNNALGSIDVSSNIALTYLNCNSTGLNTLDVTQNTALTNLQCADNNLTSLDLSQNTALSSFYCNVNNLSTLDLSQNVGLLSLSCAANSLTSLDLSQNPSVFDINCIQNDLATLNVTACTNLTTLACQNNLLEVLDVSNNTSLTGLNCQNNSLTVLNMKNLSTTTNLTSYFFATSNNLTCIDVDNVAAATSTWTNIDGGVSFNTNCVIDLVSSIAVSGQAGVSVITTLGGTLQMEASVLPSYADDDTYTWSVTNLSGSASIDANGLLTALTDGNVRVTATANDASAVTGTAIVTISNQGVGINEAAAAINLRAYPNPVSQQLNIEADEVIDAITLLDITGKTVRTFSRVSNSIDLSGLDNGVYLLQVQTAKGIATQRLIKN